MLHLPPRMGETIRLEEAKADDLIFLGSVSRIGHAGMIYQNHNGAIDGHAAFHKGWLSKKVRMLILNIAYRSWLVCKD